MDSSFIDATNHSRRVAEISRLLADEGGRQDAALIEACALLHDVGKMDIPPEILNKPDKLTPEEFAIVKTHAELGCRRILKIIDLLEAAALIARYHHEHWNGDGYAGIAGQDIHPYARIVAVADVLDALMSKRSYKDGWSYDDALSYMKAEAGKHFDPAWINALLACERQVSALYNNER